jgi:hypothetical protein
MALRTVVDFLREGHIVVLFNRSKRIIYQVKGKEPTQVNSCDCTSAMGDILEEDDWPWYIKNELGENLITLELVPEGLPVQNYKMN